MIRLIIIIAVLVIQSGIPRPVLSWDGMKTVRDADGNEYYIDSIGKIWTSGKPEFEYRPVSREGLTYYLNHGIQLIRGGHQVSGLTLLKSIMALPVTTESIRRVRTEASRVINDITMKEGKRYDRWNERASILLYREDRGITIINDRMRYRMRFPFEVQVLRNTLRTGVSYRYQGVVCAVLPEKGTGRVRGDMKEYDALITVNSEEFRSKISDTGELEYNWRTHLGDLGRERKEIFRKDDRVVYEYLDSKGMTPEGLEAYYIIGTRGHYVTIYPGKDKSGNRRGFFIGMLREFEMY